MQIAIRGIRLFAKHGVFDFEKKQDQLFVVDVELELCEEPKADELASTIDYSAVVDLVARHFAAAPVDLIETLASRIADELVAMPNVDRVLATVHKPNVKLSRPVADVSVAAERTRQ